MYPASICRAKGGPVRGRRLAGRNESATAAVACLASRSSRCPIAPTFRLMLEQGKSLPPGNASFRKIFASRYDMRLAYRHWNQVHCGWLRSFNACARGETVAPFPETKPHLLQHE